MSKLTNECPICTEEFKNSDEIFSTSCGHIFHRPCMNQCLKNGSICPLCRQRVLTVHKLYLTLDDKEPEKPEKTTELELKLRSSLEENAKLLDQKNVIEFEFVQIQEQYTVSEQERKKLEERIKQLNNSEQNFLDLQKQYTETTEIVKHLELEYKELLVKNESLINELRLKSFELESLKNNSDAAQNITSNGIESGKIKILEQKLNYYTSELEKEISNNTKLSIVNLKLQSYIDVMKSKEISSSEESIENSNFKENFNNSLRTNSKDEQNNSTTKIIIRDIPRNIITVPLVNVIINLASKMKFTISPEDIAQVKIVSDDKQISSKGVLMVEFKSIQLRNKFMSNKNILKNDPSTNSIAIDCIDDEMYSLLMYAKKKLKNNKYNRVFYKNNQIFAKKRRTHSRIIRINDKADVDTLRNRNQSSEINTKLIQSSEINTKLIQSSEININDTVEINESIVDENYYQI